MLLHHIIKPIRRLNGGSDQYIARGRGEPGRVFERLVTPVLMALTSRRAVTRHCRANRPPQMSHPLSLSSAPPKPLSVGTEVTSVLDDNGAKGQSL